MTFLHHVKGFSSLSYNTMGLENEQLIKKVTTLLALERTYSDHRESKQPAIQFTLDKMSLEIEKLEKAMELITEIRALLTESSQILTIHQSRALRALREINYEGVTLRTWDHLGLVEEVLAGYSEETVKELSERFWDFVVAPLSSNFIHMDEQIGTIVVSQHVPQFLNRQLQNLKLCYKLGVVVRSSDDVPFEIMREKYKEAYRMAEVAVSKEIWAEILSRIDRLRWITA